MLEPFRSEFNQQQFSPGRYAELKSRLNARTRTKIDFRICETPCFFPAALLDEMVQTGRELTHQLLDNPEYMRLSDGAIPDRYRIPNDNHRPNFMTVDFGLVRNEAGRLEPRLVELQAFPSILGYQEYLCQEYVNTYGLSEELTWRLDGRTESQYWELLRQTIVGDHAPENVVLTEVDPESQKTLPDFHVYEQQLGVRTVDITHLRKEGRKLLYERDGIWTPIRRIFNRAIVDEMQRRRVQPAFDYRDDLEVEWAGNPNGYFRLSKFSLPFLEHPSVPKAIFLDDWFRGRREGLPEERQNLLLKPLYSFAGKGVHFSPTDKELDAIPEAERGNYLLQSRVRFEPVILTPQGPTQAEVRVMYCWPEALAQMTPVTCLVRLGRGLMMGVDHNRDQSWVGGSAALLQR